MTSHSQFPPRCKAGRAAWSSSAAGLAGLFTALKLAPRPVTVVSAARLGEGASSLWAQGGIAAALAEGDSPESIMPTNDRAGAGIVDEKIAELLAREAPRPGRRPAPLWRSLRPGPRGPFQPGPRGGAWPQPHRARQGRHRRARHHGGAARRRQRHAVDHRDRGLRRPRSPAARRPCAGRRARAGRWRRVGAGLHCCRRARWCSRPAASGSSTRSPPIRARRAARASPSRRGPAPSSPTPSSSSSIRPRSMSAATPPRSPPRRCAAKARC